MEISSGSILLRDMNEGDIEDYVRGFTRDTDWTDTDAPWEPLEGDEDSQRRDWSEYYESVKGLQEDALRWKFELCAHGHHIGWVSSYYIDENFEWTDSRSVQEGQSVRLALGIDICEAQYRGRGFGTLALRAFAEYLFAHGFEELYTQTWSGNAGMLGCAAKLGFAECARIKDAREVGGSKYDAVTLRLKS